MKEVKLYNTDNHNVYLRNDETNKRKYILTGDYVSVTITEDEIENADGSKTRFIVGIDPDGGPKIFVNNFIINYNVDLGDSVEMNLERIEFDETYNCFNLFFKEIDPTLDITKDKI